jgi:hypothetical protein
MREYMVQEVQTMKEQVCYSEYADNNQPLL